MTTFLPTDSNDNAIPVLRFKPSGAHKISATTSAAARNAAAFDSDTKVISVYAAQDVYIAFGGSSVTATNTDHFIPAGMYFDIAIGGENAGHTPYMSVLSATTDATVYVSERF